MSPDEKFQEQKQKEEQEKLRMCIDQLSEEDREHIFKLGLLKKCFYTILAKDIINLSNGFMENIIFRLLW